MKTQHSPIESSLFNEEELEQTRFLIVSCYKNARNPKAL